MQILIAGLGAIGQRHARNLRALRGAGVELTAYRRRRLRFVVTDALTRDDTRDLEAELGVRAYDDLDAALAAKPAAVFVCTPSSQHLEIAQRAAMAGCHLFIEKPLSDGLTGVQQLLDTVMSKRLVALVGCQWRFHPGVRALKQLVVTGTLGRFRCAEINYAEYLPDWHPYEDYRESYAARAALGGGVILTQIHDYDLAFWLFGMPGAVRATGGKLSDLEIDVEDTVDAEFDVDGGTVRVRQTFASRPPCRTIVVRGERATATLDLLAGTLAVDPTVAVVASFPEYPRNEMFVAEASHFLDCVEGRAEPVIPITDGALVLRMALAAKSAMQTGQRVTIT